MIVKKIDGQWQVIGEWCNNQPYIMYQIPHFVKLDKNGQPIKINEWEYEPAENNDFWIDQSRQGTKCNGDCSNCKDCYILADDFKDDLNLYNVTFNGKQIVVGELNDLGKKRELQRELNTLLNWFVYYDNQVMQYNRSVRLGEPFDKDIQTLDEQAKVNASRIKSLKTLLGK